MKRFQFRLERVLQVKQRAAEAALAILVEKNGIVRNLEDRLEAIAAAQAGNGVASTDSGVPVESLWLVGLFGERLQQELENTQLALISARNEAEEALVDYQEAHKEEEALLRLREKKQLEYQEYVAHEEEKFLDELQIQQRNSSNAKEMNDGR